LEVTICDLLLKNLSLTREEIMRISQIVTSSEIKFSKSVRCFTEQGVAMFNSLNAQFV
jgi:hypothetical protein